MAFIEGKSKQTNVTDKLFPITLTLCTSINGHRLHGPCNEFLSYTRLINMPRS